MDFVDKLNQLIARIETIKDNIQTEEATKTSMVMPFFQLLGYDVFNPLEFTPEYTADVGIKKGEKVDYAIMDENGLPVILIEAKWCGDSLDKHGSQLFRYFSTTTAKFGILTNGIVYRFYTDLDEVNIMDERPFLEFDLTDIKDSLIPELKKFQRQSFDIELIHNSASELKYGGLIKQLLFQQFSSPTDDFVKYVLSEVYDGVKTQKMVESFKPIIKKAFSQFMNELINDRLQTAIKNEDVVQDDKDVEEPQPTSNIITTDEEIESFFIIKSILHEYLTEVDHKLTYKDTQTYFGILLDGNTWKCVCRLYLSEQRKKIIFPKIEKSYYLKSIDDLYAFKDDLINAVNFIVSK
jgi:hypothetical protein